MLGKLFGSKKDEYFLEFGDAKDQQAPPADAKPALQAKTESVKPSQAQAKAAPAAQPQTTVLTPAQPPAPVKEPAPLNNGMAKTPAGMTFAPDNLMPNSSTPRRSPGPSLEMFKNMAGQMKRS
ncbi:MAG: hypothetical protein ACKPEN_07520 [Planktothrix sp.]|uniref:hypothetical protein n=1 Tax=Planktothrix sp. TaxID=3088171 RepID=UPI0038D441A1